MLSDTEKKKKKKNMVRTVNASGAQCSAGHEILNRKIRCKFFFSLLVRQGNWMSAADGGGGAYEA